MTNVSPFNVPMANNVLTLLTATSAVVRSVSLAYSAAIISTIANRLPASMAVRVLMELPITPAPAHQDSPEEIVLKMSTNAPF